ncbi:MAG: tetratricopeptide repeat protein, partial [Deltaproteobacteria bacterium]|nr:tetratricopeptide repeat protein [Deltaproteobacteria bacterium]
MQPRTDEPPATPPAPETTGEGGGPRWLRPYRSAAGRVAGFFASRWCLPAVLGLGALLCGLHLAFLAGSPFWGQLQLDHAYYHEWAERIRSGGFWGEGVWFVDPLYAYFLAAAYTVFGPSLTAVRVLQVVLFLATAGLTARLGRRTLGSVAAGNLAALLFVLFLPAVYQVGLAEKAMLAAFLLTLAVERFLTLRPAALLGSGVALGLACLARGGLLPLIPAGLAALLLLGRRDELPAGADDRPPARVVPPRVLRQRAALFAAGALAVIGLATVRNAIVGGEFVPTTANAGQNLYLGQHRGNETGTYGGVSFARADPRYEEADFRAEAVRRTGNPALRPGEVSDFWLREAVSEMAAAPGATVRRTLRKLHLLVHQFEVPDNDNLELVAEYSPVLRLPLPGFGLLWPFAVLGTVVLWRSRRIRVLLCVVLVYAVVPATFFVVARFRLPLVPLLAVPAAGGVLWLGRAFAARRRQAWWAVAALGVGLALCFVRPGWLEALRTRGLAVAWNNLGAMLLETGDTDRAMDAFERAVELAPAAVVGALRTLGDLHLARGEFAAAERVMRRVLELKPDSRRGRQAVVRLYETMLRDPQRADDPDVRGKLAEARQALSEALPDAEAREGAPRADELRVRSRELRAAGRWGEAIAALQEALRLEPHDEGTAYLLGGLMERHAAPEELVAFWSAHVAVDAKPQTSHYFWGVGLERLGDLDGATARFAEGLRIDPAHELSEHALGRVAERRGRLDEALAHYERATEIHPEFREAHESCARVLDAVGREAEAEERRATARRSDPNTPRRYRYWGRYLVRAGRWAAAIPELEQALRVDPGDEEARRLLEQARAEVPGASRAEVP